jgi:hypothetical protein
MLELCVVESTSNISVVINFTTSYYLLYDIRFQFSILILKIRIVDNDNYYNDNYSHLIPL